MTMITVPGTATVSDLAEYTPVVLERDLQVQSVADYVPAEAGVDSTPAPRLTVLATASCVQCTATKRKLETDGVVPFEYRMLTDEERDHYKALGHMQAPIVIDNESGAIWTGNNPIELMRVTAEERSKLAA